MSEKAPKRAKKRARLSISGVIGELFITAGLGTLGFVVWQPWYAQTVIAGKQADISIEVSKQWDLDSGSTPPPQPAPKPEGTSQASAAAPVPKLGLSGKQGDVFAVLYVPRLGPDWANTIAGGQNMKSIIDSTALGVGHYAETQTIGENGNFAVAAHRSGYITPFANVDFLRVGDPLYIETKDGWYTYRFRSFEYVLPTDVTVLRPFPWMEKVEATDKILTLTTCYPKAWGDTERQISYSVFEKFTPRADGPPKELIAANSKVAAAAAEAKKKAGR
ncbi:MAG: class E sortase [Microbacteriaceae bacterium]|nr:class E sortase [Microbacteriaceae bacterium]